MTAPLAVVEPHGTRGAALSVRCGSLMGMCGRYVVATPVDQLAAEFEAGLELADFPPDYNVAPTKQVPAVLVRDGARVLTSLRWGLVPFWAKDPSIGARMINARVETVGEKPAYREAFARHRCLLPADGYYEWLKSAAPKGGKQPYFIHPADHGRLALAGVCAKWRDAEGVELRTVAIVTGAAAGPAARIHDRMPLTVARAAWDSWLDPGLADPQAARALLDPAPRLAAYPVRDQVNSPRNNGAHLIEPDPQAQRAESPEPGMDPPGVLF